MAINEEIKQSLNGISSCLSEGAVWHRRAANECRKFPNIRGWGRWHDSEAENDFKTLLNLEKLIRDNLHYSPVVDISKISKAYNYTINDLEAFKNHHTQWINREKIFQDALTEVLEDIRQVDMKLFKYLCGCMESVQNETKCVDRVYAGMITSVWNAHDLKVTSRWIHEYFENNYKGGKIDFNIG